MTSTHENSPLKIAVITGFFSWLGDVILYPIDTISTRLKGDKHTSFNTLKFMWEKLKTERIKLYRGFALTLPHSFIPTGIYVFAYQSMMRKMSQIVDRFTSRQQVKLFFPFFISGISEFMCLILELPFDTLRTRIQMNPDYQYKSIFAGLKEIYQKEGLLRFYKATRIYFVSKIIYTATQFQAFQTLRYYTNGSISMLLINTILATLVATTITNPLEVIITRYALVDTTKKKLIFSILVKKMFQREGISGFYKGYYTEVITHSCYALFWLPIFQIMREQLGVKIHE